MQSKLNTQLKLQQNSFKKSQKATLLIILPLLVRSFFPHAENSSRKKVLARAEPFVPANLYPVERLPTYFNRVVVLPCYHADPDSPLLDYIDDVFHQELAQERIFETFEFLPIKCRGYLVPRRISSSSDLPENFLELWMSKPVQTAFSLWTWILTDRTTDVLRRKGQAMD